MLSNKEDDEDIGQESFVSAFKNQASLIMKALSGNVCGNATLNAYIVIKHIANFDISGATMLTLANFWNTADGWIELSGASNFTVGVMAQHLNLDVGGAYRVDFFWKSKFF